MAEQRKPAAPVQDHPAEVRYQEVIPGGFVARLKAWPKSVKPADQEQAKD